MCEIKVVCFDLGRVLVRTCCSWPDCFVKAGLDVPMTLQGEKRCEVERQLDSLISKNECGSISQEDFCAQVSEILGISRGEMDQVNASFLQGKYEGVDELIDELQRVDGLKLACLSNTNVFHWGMQTGEIGGLGGGALPLDAMDYRFASFLLGEMKPAKEIYARVQQEMRVEADQILFFDDNEENIEAAACCGWRAERVMDCEDPVNEIRGILERYEILKPEKI